MSVPFDIENERIEIRDDDGNNLVFRPVAVIGSGEEIYYVFGAMQTQDDGQFRQMRLMLVRKEETEDGASHYVICDEENEVKQIVGSYVRQAIEEIARRADGEEEEDAEETVCDLCHAPGEFCYCDQPEYLQ